MEREIRERVIKCARRVKDNPAFDLAENDTAPLTGGIYQFSSVEMTWLLLEILDEFRIRLEKEDVENYRFNTVAGIVETVMKRTKESE